MDHDQTWCILSPYVNLKAYLFSKSKVKVKGSICHSVTSLLLIYYRKTLLFVFIINTLSLYRIDRDQHIGYTIHIWNQTNWCVLVILYCCQLGMSTTGAFNCAGNKLTSFTLSPSGKNCNFSIDTIQCTSKHLGRGGHSPKRRRWYVYKE